MPDSHSDTISLPRDRSHASMVAPSAEELIRDITALRPWLREKQFEAERQRRIPEETVKRLDEIGVYTLTSPARFGGADLSSRELFRVYEALGRGCGATSWTVWASTGGNMWSAAFPDEVVEPIYADPWVGSRTCAVGGSTRRLAGTARKTEGGWMIKGAWPFATGGAHASHAYLAVYLDEADDNKVGMALVPRNEYTRLDDWDTIGMAGTGSSTIVIREELFVPDARFSTPQILLERLSTMREMNIPVRPGGLGRSIMVGSGNAVGMAEYALELYLESADKKPIAYSTYKRQADAPVTHLNVAYAKMQIKAARLVAEAALDDLDRLHEENGDVSPSEMTRYQADTAFVWDTCATVAESLFKASGASAVARKQPIQLVARNCRTGSMHAVHSIQTCMENYGRYLCGFEIKLSTGNVIERVR